MTSLSVDRYNGGGWDRRFSRAWPSARSARFWALSADGDVMGEDATSCGADGSRYKSIRKATTSPLQTELAHVLRSEARRILQPTLEQRQWFAMLSHWLGSFATVL